jgi:hypothetical protein
MTHYFDIFALEADDEDSVRWLEAVISLEQANARVHELSIAGYSRFLILDQNTGAKRILTGSGAAANDLVA